jgi:hypothetical protein
MVSIKKNKKNKIKIKYLKIKYIKKKKKKKKKNYFRPPNYKGLPPENPVAS